MGDPLPQVLSAISCIKAEGIKTALLTNNWKKADGSTLLCASPELFDVVSFTTIEAYILNINLVKSVE